VEPVPGSSYRSLARLPAAIALVGAALG
jgi:hypothetical protein